MRRPLLILSLLLPTSSALAKGSRPFFGLGAGHVSLQGTRGAPSGDFSGAAYSLRMIFPVEGGKAEAWTSMTHLDHSGVTYGAAPSLSSVAAGSGQALSLDLLDLTLILGGEVAADVLSHKKDLYLGLAGRLSGELRRPLLGGEVSLRTLASPWGERLTSAKGSSLISRNRWEILFSVEIMTP